jgi:hypothetical protein
MSGTTDHPPSTTNPTHPPRRVLTTIGAALLALIVLIGLVAATQGPSGSAAAAEPTTTRDDREQIRSFRDGPGALDRLALVAQAVAPPTTAPTTTTTAPPAPTTTAPPPPQPAVAPIASGSGYNDPNNPAAWDRLAQCESGGNWAANTGNGYYGGLQFSLGSWQGVGGTGRPDQASRETQIAMGQRLWNQGGWRHWPACTLKLGYR